MTPERAIGVHPAREKWQTLLRWWVPILLLGLVLALGGKAAYARQLALTVCALGAFFAWWTLPKRCRLAPWTWLLVLLGPMIVIALAQAAPLGVWHPWVDPDVALLGSELGQPRWSLDAGASLRSAVWWMALLVVALMTMVQWRGVRMRVLADAIILLVSAHAVFALIGSAGFPDWPSERSYAGRVRGAFVYPNHFAAFTAAVVPLALARAASHRWQWWRVGAVMILAGAVAASASRGGLAVMLMGGVPMLWSVIPRAQRWRWSALAVAVIAVLMMLVNVQTTTERLGDLNHEAVSLNGRTSIWNAAVPLGLEHAMGSGAGTAHLAFPRASLDIFEPNRILHMHSDPVGLLVTLGWLGAGWSFGGMVGGVVLWWRRREPGWASGERGLLAFGAGMALLQLLVHSCVDHIFMSEAIDVLGVVLLVLICVAAPGGDPAVRSTRSLRMALMVLGLALSALLWADWMREHHRVIARDAIVSADTAAELRTPAQVAAVESAMAVTAFWHPDIGVSQAQILASIENTSIGAAQDTAGKMQLAVRRAQALTPGHPELWTEALRAAIPLGDEAFIQQAVARSRVWSPVAYRTQLLWQRAIAIGMACVEVRETEQFIQELLVQSGPRPQWFGAAVRRVLGDQALAEFLDAHEAQITPASWRALAPTLAHYGTLRHWLQARQHDWVHKLSPVQAVVNEYRSRSDSSNWTAEGGDQPLSFGGLPQSPPQLAQLGQWLQTAGLPFPAHLKSALVELGHPWVVVLDPPRWNDADWRSQHEVDLAPFVAQQWVRRRLATIERIEHAGLPQSGDDPQAVLAMWTMAREQEERGREEAAHAILSRYQVLRWQTMGAARRAWVWVEEPNPAPSIPLDRWTMLIVNGEPLGWHRGVVPLSAYLTSGLHQVALVEW